MGLNGREKRDDARMYVRKLWEMEAKNPDVLCRKYSPNQISAIVQTKDLESSIIQDAMRRVSSKNTYRLHVVYIGDVAQDGSWILMDGEIYTKQEKEGVVYHVIGNKLK